MAALKEAMAFYWGFSLGAGTMFLLDPRQGGARRAQLRDKSVHVRRELEKGAEIAARDLSHRTAGFVARTRGAAREDHPEPGVLVERVRATIGHHCSHPHAIAVTATEGGTVELRGPILRSDVDDVLGAVSRVRGVRAIDDDLDVHDAPGDVPGLQGEAHRRPRAHRTTPATKLLLGAVAAGTAAASIASGNPVGLLLGGAGVLTLARSVTTRSRTLLPHASHA